MMDFNQQKLGYSTHGGIFIGKNIQSDYHKHHLISIIISFEDSFRIKIKSKDENIYKAVIVQNDINYRLESNMNNYIAFIHIDPFSVYGLQLLQKNRPIQSIVSDEKEDLIHELRIWYTNSDNSEENTKALLDKIISIISKNKEYRQELDDRIKISLNLINQSTEEKLSIKHASASVNLSPSHYARLFKKETGITFRKYVLHCKLVKSLYAMYKKQNLTEASHFGGFSDQPHFTRTFKNAFGIKPSSSKK